jgi:integrase/recombinase XerD
MDESLPALDLPGRLNPGISLLAENKSATTISSYVRGVRLRSRWIEENGHSMELTRGRVEQCSAELVAEGKEPNTVRLRRAALRQFCRWLVDEGESPADPLLGLKPPKTLAIGAWPTRRTSDG